MKRLHFSQSTDKKTLFTNEILCLNDVFLGKISLNVDNIEWQVFNSSNEIVESGVSKTVSDAQKQIKNTLITYGAKFDPEFRKYKI